VPRCARDDGSGIVAVRIGANRRPPLDAPDYRTGVRTIAAAVHQPAEVVPGAVFGDDSGARGFRAHGLEPDAWGEQV